MDFFILSMVFSLSLTGKQLATTEAIRAYTKQSGIDQAFDDFQKREISAPWRAGIGNGIWIAKTISSQQVTLTWSF